MRRLLVAGFAALAVLLGLVVTTGVASAAAPTDAAGCAAARAALAAATPATRAALEAAAHTACAGLGGDRGDRGGLGGRDRGGFGGHGVNPGGPIVGHGNGGHWIPGGNVPWGGPTLFGHQLWLQANLGLDICGFGNSYSTFVDRNLRYRSDIDRYLGASRWQSLYSSDCGSSSIAVLPGGLNLVNGNLLNLSLLGLNGAGTVNVCDYPSYDVFNSRLGGRFGNRWDTVRNRFGSRGFDVYRQLRVNARCTTVMIPSSTTIVQDPNTTYSASPTTDPSSGDAGVSDTPASSTPLPAIAPAKAPSTGGWDTASMLAHARVV